MMSQEEFAALKIGDKVFIDVIKFDGSIWNKDGLMDHLKGTVGTVLRRGSTSPNIIVVDTGEEQTWMYNRFMLSTVPGNAHWYAKGETGAPGIPGVSCYDPIAQGEALLAIETKEKEELCSVKGMLYVILGGKPVPCCAGPDIPVPPARCLECALYEPFNPDDGKTVNQSRYN